MVLNFQLKVLKENIFRKLKLLITEKFQSYLGYLNDKNNLVKKVFQNLRETLPYILTTSQTIYLASNRAAS